MFLDKYSYNRTENLLIVEINLVSREKYLTRQCIQQKIHSHITVRKILLTLKIIKIKFYWIGDNINIIRMRVKYRFF